MTLSLLIFSFNNPISYILLFFSLSLFLSLYTLLSYLSSHFYLPSTFLIPLFLYFRVILPWKKNAGKKRMNFFSFLFFFFFFLFLFFLRFIGLFNLFQSRGEEGYFLFASLFL